MHQAPAKGRPQLQAGKGRLPAQGLLPSPAAALSSCRGRCRHLVRWT